MGKKDLLRMSYIQCPGLIIHIGIVDDMSKVGCLPGYIVKLFSSRGVPELSTAQTQPYCCSVLLLTVHLGRPTTRGSSAFSIIAVTQWQDAER